MYRNRNVYDECNTQSIHDFITYFLLLAGGNSCSLLLSVTIVHVQLLKKDVFSYAFKNPSYDDFEIKCFRFPPILCLTNSFKKLTFRIILGLEHIQLTLFSYCCQVKLELGTILTNPFRYLSMFTLNLVNINISEHESNLLIFIMRTISCLFRSNFKVWFRSDDFESVVKLLQGEVINMRQGWRCVQIRPFDWFRE